MSAAADSLAAALLDALAEADPLSPRPFTAHELCERLTAASAAAARPDEPAAERRLRALEADGLVEGLHEPYQPSRYLITRAGRARAASGI